MGRPYSETHSECLDFCGEEYLVLLIITRLHIYTFILFFKIVIL